MNYKFVLKILGTLLMGLSMTMVLPMFVSIMLDSGKDKNDFVGFLFSIVVTMIVGLTLLKLPVKNQKLNIRSSIAVVVFGWLAFCIFGSLPYLLINTGLSFTDCVFETMSGFTTTGATVLVDIEAMSKGILFWRSLTQWIGGMGIIVLSLAIMPLLGSAGTVLYRSEVPGPSSDKLMPRLQATAKILWVVYVAFTIVLAILLKIFGMDWFEAFCHGFTTMATGGFSTRGGSIGEFSELIQWTIAIFMLLGGANFSLHYLLFTTGKISYFMKNREFLSYCFFIGLGTVVIFFLQFGWKNDFSFSLIQSVFHSISIITSSGFIIGDYELWSPAAQLMVLLLFFVGGCGGSTAGGVKVIRLYVMVKIALIQVAQVLHPHGVYFIKIGKTTVKEEVIGKVMGFIILYIALLTSCSLILCALGHDVTTSFSAIASALGNVGPGFGEVGATESYSGISVLGKWIIIFCMLAGRLELFTVLVVFSRGFWKKI